MMVVSAKQDKIFPVYLHVKVDGSYYLKVGATIEYF